MSGTVAEQFEDHAVWPELDRLEDALTQATGPLENTSPQITSIHASLVAFGEYVRSTLGASDPALVPETKLEAIRSGISRVANYAEKYIQTEAESELLEAWSNTANVFSSLSGLPTIKTPTSARGLASSIGAYQRRMREQVESLQTRAEEVRSELDTLDVARHDLAREFNSQKQQIAAALVSFNEQVEAERNTHATEHTEALNELRATVANLEAAATTQRAEAGKLAQEQITGFRSDFNDHIGAWEEQADEHHQKRSDQAEHLIEALNDQLTQAKNLVGLTGQVAMKGHYRRNADEQGEAADFWRWATVGASAAAVISAIIVTVLEFIYASDPNWTVIVRGTTVTVALSGLAAFLGFQTTNHREKEQQYRSLELELATLDPFLNSLEEDDRKRIKAELAMRYFVGIERDQIDEFALPDE